MLHTFEDVCIVSANCNKVNREKTWLQGIFAPAKVFFRLVDYVDYATYHRHILTGPGLICEGCLFSGGRVHPTPVFLFNRGGLRSCGTKVLPNFRYIAGQDSAPVETDTSGPARLKAGPGRGVECQTPCSACCSVKEC